MIGTVNGNEEAIRITFFHVCAADRQINKTCFIPHAMMESENVAEYEWPLVE